MLLLSALSIKCIIQEQLDPDRGQVTSLTSDTTIYWKDDRRDRATLEVTLIKTTATAHYYNQECEKLHTHTTNATFRSANYSVRNIYSHRVTVDLKNVYLLGGSSVNFSVHIIRINTSTNDMTFMAFDNVKLYHQCINGEDKDCSPKTRNPIDPNHSETTFQYRVNSTGYYYMLFICHGDFEFYFTYFEHTLYYNHTDYKPTCNFTVDDISKQKVCTFSYKGSNDVCLLEYLTPTINIQSNLTTQWYFHGSKDEDFSHCPYRFSLIMILFGVVLFVVGIMILLIYFYCKKRRGYKKV